MLDKILISQCLLGDKVRYDGKLIPFTHPLIALWKKQNRLIAICPEVAGGLPVPRPPAERKQSNGQLYTQAGINVTAQFTLGAQKTLALCQKHQIRFALLKESSPSCGSTMVYDGSFNNKKIRGQGITSELLTQHGIRVFSENTVDELMQQLDQ